MDIYNSSNEEVSTRNYKDITFPTSSSSGTGTLTVSSVGASEGSVFTVWIWVSSGSSVTFNNYKVKINLTKVESKTVTYGSTYGTLPTPSRSGYTFAGWYTSLSGGTKITSSSTVNITSAQTLYAHWN